MPWCPRCGTGISDMEIETEGYQDVTHRQRLRALPAGGSAQRVPAGLDDDALDAGRQRRGGGQPRADLRQGRAGRRDLLPLRRRSCQAERRCAARAWRGDGSRDAAGADYWSAGATRGPSTSCPAAAGVRASRDPLGRGQRRARARASSTSRLAAAERTSRSRKEHGLPVLAPLDEIGVYVDGYDWLTGQYVARGRRPIFDEPAARRAASTRPSHYQHRYPHCWRCRTELVFRLVDEWFISMDELREMTTGASDASPSRSAGSPSSAWSASWTGCATWTTG